VDHNEVLPRCDDCHNRNNPIAGADRPPNDNDHRNLGNRDCDDCHNTRNFD